MDAFVVLLLISAAIVFIDSSMVDINKSMPGISEGIVQGDKDYNESVRLLNSGYFEDANQKAISAGDNYNNSLHDLEKIRDNYDKDLNKVHKNYIDATINELELKLKAIDELKEAIYYLNLYFKQITLNYSVQSHFFHFDILMHLTLNH